MPVHMRGLPSNMGKIMDIAKRYNLKVIEDCAQADGGSCKGKRLGTFGDAGCFSFDFYKIINTGEGGMVVTNNEKIYIRTQSWHGTAACLRPNRYARESISGEIFYGENYRMGQINAGIGLSQLKKLDNCLSKLRRNKKKLIEYIGEVKRVKYAPVNDSEGDCSVINSPLFPTSEVGKEDC